MACVQRLRSDIDLIKNTFPNSHPIFQTVCGTVDELSFAFLTPDGSKKSMQATVSSTDYPNEPPIWFSDCDDEKVAAALMKLADLPPNKYSIISQISELVELLCQEYEVPVPHAELSSFVASGGDVDSGEDSENGSAHGNDYEADSDNELELMDDDDEEAFGAEEPSQNPAASSAAVGDGPDDLMPEDEQMIERCLKRIRDDHMAYKNNQDVAASTSQKHSTLASRQVVASVADAPKDGIVTSAAIVHQMSHSTISRLTSELREFMRSHLRKNGTASIETVDNKISEWYIYVYKFDPDSQLSKDLKKLKSKTDQNYVKLHATFNDSYPFRPPFVRIVSPVIRAGFVQSTGAICMELLTPNGWRASYNMEAVIVQVTATMVKGRAQIDFNANPELLYSHRKAVNSFRSIVNLHNKSGWYQPHQNEG